jgi:hypothetical protein
MPDLHQLRFLRGPETTGIRGRAGQAPKDWLLHGVIPADITLETDLTGPGYHLNRSEQLVIESKQDMVKRGVASLDYGDALALTWAGCVPPTAATQQWPEERFMGGLVPSMPGWMG